MSDRKSKPWGLTDFSGSWEDSYNLTKKEAEGQFYDRERSQAYSMLFKLWSVSRDERLVTGDLIDDDPTENIPHYSLYFPHNFCTESLLAISSLLSSSSDVYILSTHISSTKYIVIGKG